MIKYRSLVRLVEVLQPAISNGRLRLGDGWRDNEQALGLELAADPRLSAFVFTYGQPDGRYGVDLGYPDPTLAAAAGVPLLRERLRLEDLLGLLDSHFDLTTDA